MSDYTHQHGDILNSRYVRMACTVMCIPRLLGLFYQSCENDPLEEYSTPSIYVAGYWGCRDSLEVIDMS